jgi:ribosomal protein S18 acetylase RimI-like enzyme
MESNLREMLAVFARAKAAGDVRALPGIAVCSSGLEFAMFNGAILTAPVGSVAELEERIQTAAAYYAARALPWSIWVCREWLAGPVRSKVTETCHRQGMRLVVELPGMEAASLEAPLRPAPELEFQRVDDARTRSDFNSIMTVAFGIPYSLARQIYESKKTWLGGFTGWVAYREGVAVATAATLVAGGAIGVYSVGTLPQYRRKGYGEAVMRRALDEARTESGLERSVLQSSAEGLHLYQRMGYRSVARYAVFAKS